MHCAYLSNLSPIWGFERQQLLLAAAVPGFPADVRVFRDELDPRVRQGRKPASLTARARMLGQDSGRTPEVILVASLAVLAWTAEDMLQCLTLALARNATVRVLDMQIEIAPFPGVAVLHEAAKAFAAGRAAKSASVGGSVAGKQKEAAAREKADKVKDIYGMSTKAMPWSKLMEISGVSRNTIIKHLGTRADAQDAYAGNEARAATRAKREEKGK